MRAPTPSAAAELAVPDMREIGMRVISYATRCDAALVRACSRGRDRLDAVRSSEIFARPENVFAPLRDSLDVLSRDVLRAIMLKLSEKRSDFAAIAGKLEALSPLSVLSRGYAVVRSDSSALTDSGMVAIGDKLSITLSKGSLTATVTDKS